DPGCRGDGRPLLPRDERGGARQHLPSDRRTGEDVGQRPSLRRLHAEVPPVRPSRSGADRRGVAAPRQPVGEGAMSFSRPDLLWLVFALPVVVGLGVLGYARRRRRVAALFGSAGLVERLGGGALLRFPTARLTLLTFAAAALGVAAAGPRWGYEVVEAGSRSLNVVLAVDVSKSMLARDLAPNRLERQRLLARRLLRELEGDRIGL